MNSKFEQFKDLDSKQIYKELNKATTNKDYELISYLLEKDAILKDIAANHNDILSGDPKTEIGILLKKISTNKKEDLLKVLEKKGNNLWIDDNPSHFNFSEHFSFPTLFPNTKIIQDFAKEAGQVENLINDTNSTSPQNFNDRFKDVLNNLRSNSDKNTNHNKGNTPK
jgi:hypothetical protein